MAGRARGPCGRCGFGLRLRCSRFGRSTLRFLSPFSARSCAVRPTLRPVRAGPALPPRARRVRPVGPLTEVGPSRAGAPRPPPPLGGPWPAPCPRVGLGSSCRLALPRAHIPAAVLAVPPPPRWSFHRSPGRVGCSARFAPRSGRVIALLSFPALLGAPPRGACAGRWPFRPPARGRGRVRHQARRCRGSRFARHIGACGAFFRLARGVAGRARWGFPSVRWPEVCPQRSRPESTPRIALFFRRGAAVCGGRNAPPPAPPRAAAGPRPFSGGVPPRPPRPLGGVFHSPACGAPAAQFCVLACGSDAPTPLNIHKKA